MLGDRCVCGSAAAVAKQLGEAEAARRVALLAMNAVIGARLFLPAPGGRRIPLGDQLGGALTADAGAAATCSLELAPRTLAITGRGTTAAVLSGLAFYFVLDQLWGDPPPEGRNYALQFGAWAVAWAPGLLALTLRLRR